jgi:type IV pilus assembly protein PilA
MMPIAIVGILAVVSLPAYLDYQGRLRVESALALADPARAAIEKGFAELGPADMTQLAGAGWKPPTPMDYVQSVAVAGNGVITIRFTQRFAEADKNQIQIVPVAGGKAIDLSDAANKGTKFEWECGGTAGKTTLPARFRPAKCR